MGRYKMACTGQEVDARNAIIRIIERASRLKILPFESNTRKSIVFTIS